MYNDAKTPDQPLLCVVHIPKTAGSAIRETLISALGSEKVYWIGHKRPFEHWQNALGSEFDNYAVVGGHYSPVDFQKIERPKIFMSVVRNPVKRAISLFNYITCGVDPDHDLYNELKGRSLVEAIETSADFRRDVENRQCALIGGEPTVAAALRSICADEWFIDRHEAVEQLFARVCDRFCWPKLTLVLDNVGSEGYADSFLSDEKTITALKQINEEDSLLMSVLEKEAVRFSHPSSARSFVRAAPVDATSYGRFDVSSLRPDAHAIDPPGSATANEEKGSAVGDGAAVAGAVSVGTEISAEQLITAAYQAVLGRPADASGLQTYGALFRDVSLPQGVERVVRGLLTSPEFQSKRATAGAPENASPDSLQIGILSPEEARWVSSLGIRLDRVLLARYRPEPECQPTIYLRDRSLLNVQRVTDSLGYVNKLISQYLLHRDYFYNFTWNALDSEEVFCVFQIGDQSADQQLTIGYCGTGSGIILIPDLHFWSFRGYLELRREFNKLWLPWENRIPQAFWRGTSTGAPYLTVDSLPRLPRFRLCSAGMDNTRLHSVLDAKLTDIVQASYPDEAEKIRAYVDRLGLLAPRVPQANFLKYRFQIDIDGNSNSWSFLPKLLMGSCILKVMSDWRQWYYSGLRPWEHYVPISNDLSDLDERVAWCLDNDEQAREIAANGMKYANGIVFGTEMLKAAGSVAQASRGMLAVTS